MSKTKSAYFCQSCGFQSAKWLGKCTACNEWNTFVEEVIATPTANVPAWQTAEPGQKLTKKIPKPVALADITTSEEYRISTSDDELDRTLGGGLVPGAMVLIGGEPGIGKSTLLLQVAVGMAHKSVLYISGEESEQQIKMRADRLPQNPNNACHILTETNTQNIFKQIEILQPNVVVIDSIQTLHSSHIESAPGSVSQIRECTAELLRFAKETNTPTLLIGHITKDGAIAGPKVLEHMVDTVLQFEGDRHHTYRLLRATKNRFGSTSELGIYEMQNTGLRQVTNPSEILLSQRSDVLSGIAISATVEGMRPLLVETQALVSPAVYGTPQRSSTGIEARRMSMLLAVLEKRCGLQLGSKDVFLNITGGLKLEDPATDLGVIASIASSYYDVAIPYTTCFAAEVGLSGEVRAVSRVELRISEAEKLGFDRIFISNHNTKGIKSSAKIIAIGRVDEMFEALFG